MRVNVLTRRKRNNEESKVGQREVGSFSERKSMTVDDTELDRGVGRGRDERRNLL